MEKQLNSLYELFNNTIYRIPDYQRGFAWTKSEISAFWNDIINFDISSSYYMGVITTDKIERKDYADVLPNDSWIVDLGGYTPLYVVDGQQRLTSIIILISAIVKNMNKNKRKVINIYSIDDIRKTFLVKYKGDSKKDYTVLFGYDDKNSSDAFFKSKILGLNTYNVIIKNNKYNQNLKDAFSFFIDKLDKLSFNQIQRLYLKLTTKILFNIYQIDHEINVFVTFETMNNRGKQLSTLELLKNRLIYLSTRFDSKYKINGEAVRKQINECWKQLYDYLGKKPEKMLSDDAFLTAHTITYFFKHHSKKQMIIRRYYRDGLRHFLLDEYFTVGNIENNKIKPDDIFDYVSSLNKSMKYWYSFNYPMDNNVNPDFDKQIRIYFMKLKLQNDITYGRFRSPLGDWKVLSLYYFLTTNDNAKRKGFLKRLERLYFIYSLCDASPTSISVGVLNYKLSFDDLLDNYNNFDKDIEKFLRSDEFKTCISKLCDELSRNGWYKEHNIVTVPTKYIISEYILDLYKKAKESLNLEFVNNLYFGNDSDGMPSIEHIYPEKNNKSNNWNTFFSKYTRTEKVRIKNSLGNLLVINNKKNEKIGNKSFKDKKEHGHVGYKFGTIDEQRVASNEQWTIKEIKNRGLEIVNFINEHWGIQIPRDKRIEFIGLGKVDINKQ